MIKISNTNVYNINNAMRGMRNPLNSWAKNDTQNDVIGTNDMDLATRLRNAGAEHRKYLRQIFVSLDITAPLYWWKEFDTYKIGTTANSTSTMHTIHKRELTREDFSINDGMDMYKSVVDEFLRVVNFFRRKFLETNDKKYWRAMIQILPESFNQTRTVTLNYEVLLNMYHQRKNHKLSEWHSFCKWVETLPHSELIIGKEKEQEK